MFYKSVTSEDLLPTAWTRGVNLVLGLVLGMLIIIAVYIALH